MDKIVNNGSIEITLSEMINLFDCSLQFKMICNNLIVFQLNFKQSLRYEMKNLKIQRSVLKFIHKYPFKWLKKKKKKKKDALGITEGIKKSRM